MVLTFIVGIRSKDLLQIAKRTEIFLILVITAGLETDRPKRLSCKGRKGNALALRADEGRDKLR